MVDHVIPARLGRFGDMDAIGFLDGVKLRLAAGQADDRRAEQRDIAAKAPAYPTEREGSLRPAQAARARAGEDRQCALPQQV